VRSASLVSAILVYIFCYFSDLKANGELSGPEAERILAAAGVQRVQAPEAIPDYPPGISAHRRGPQPGKVYG
jgi:hypothetical protein